MKELLTLGLWQRIGLAAFFLSYEESRYVPLFNSISSFYTKYLSLLRFHVLSPFLSTIASFIPLDCFDHSNHRLLTNKYLSSNHWSVWNHFALTKTSSSQEVTRPLYVVIVTCINTNISRSSSTITATVPLSGQKSNKVNKRQPRWPLGRTTQNFVKLPERSPI
jgi:hypothetical protein